VDLIMGQIISDLSSSELIDLLVDLKIQKQELVLEKAELDIEYRSHKFLESKELSDKKKCEILELELKILYIEREVLRNKRKLEREDKRLRFEYSDELLAIIIDVCDNTGNSNIVKEARRVHRTREINKNKDRHLRA